MFSKLINRIMKLAELICMLLLGIAVIFVTLQIVFRYFLSSPLGWTEQTSRFCFIWIVMLGIPIMFYRKCEISFDFIREKMPEKLHNIVLLVFLCFILYLQHVTLHSYRRQTYIRDCSSIELSLCCSANISCIDTPCVCGTSERNIEIEERR